MGSKVDVGRWVGVVENETKLQVTLKLDLKLINKKLIKFLT